MGVVVVNKQPIQEPQHLCELPKWKARKRLGVRLYTVVKCKNCPAKYQWLRTGAWELGAHWEPVR